MPGGRFMNARLIFTPFPEGVIVAVPTGLPFPSTRLACAFLTACANSGIAINVAAAPNKNKFRFDIGPSSLRAAQLYPPPPAQCNRSCNVAVVITRADLQLLFSCRPSADVTTPPSAPRVITTSVATTGPQLLFRASHPSLLGLGSLRLAGRISLLVPACAGARSARQTFLQSSVRVAPSHLGVVITRSVATRDPRFRCWIAPRPPTCAAIRSTRPALLLSSCG